MMQKIDKVLIGGLLLITVALTGFSYADKQGDYVFIYDAVSREKVVITTYYRTGLFYIHTDLDDSFSQTLVRKQRPEFWSRETILNELNSEPTLLRALAGKEIYYLPGSVDNSQEILQKIIENNTDFSQKMQYYRSGVSIRGDLDEMFIGYFELNKQPYTVSITNSSYMVNG